jgi:predicted  nucleic acid-binding Zn-ribbon protein
MAFCSHCGTQIKEGAKFCRNCGGKIEESAYSANPPAEDNTVPPAEPDLDTGAGKDAEITRLNSDIKNLTAEKAQSDSEKRALTDTCKKTKKGLVAAIVIGALGILISTLVGYGRDNERSEEYTLWESLLPLNITDLQIGNVDINNNWLTMPGEPLASAKMRYLMSVITLNSAVSDTITLSCKIIDGNGVVERNTSTSPEGYTFDTTIEVTRSNGQLFYLPGWGNSDQSYYRFGEWTVEIWWNDVCLKSTKVRIN